MNERYELAIERIRSIVHEDTVASLYRDYFQKVAGFILEIDVIKNLKGVKNIDKVQGEYVISIEDDSYVKSLFKCISKFDNITKFSVLCRCCIRYLFCCNKCI